MSIHEERLAVLEQRLDALQRDVASNQGDNTRILAILNKVVTTQELNYRELSENETMLAGVISSQGIDIKEIKEDIKEIKEDVKDINKDMSTVKDRLDDLDQHLEQALQMLTTLTATLHNR
jgi:chromosome segregation ATPase